MTITATDTTRGRGRPPILTHDQLIGWIVDNRPATVNQALQGLRAEGLGSNHKRVAAAFEAAETTSAAAWLAARLVGKSWKKIADDFGYGSTTTARIAYSQATGLTDYQVKGEALAQFLLAHI